MTDRSGAISKPRHDDGGSTKSAIKSFARAGIEKISEVGVHSFRSWTINQSIASGSIPYVVRKQSGHQPDSRSFERHVRVGEIFTRNAAASLGL